MILLFIVIGILLIYQVDQRINATESSFILTICTVSTAIGGLLGIYFVYKELNASANIANADFILRLNTEFLKNDDIMKIYRKLEDSYSDITKNEGTKSQKFFNNDDKVLMASYLNYFDTIYFLLERKLIKMSDINDLFAQRFFLAVHETEFQDLELIRNHVYYRDIFLLYDQWIKYRSQNHQETLGSNNRLDKAEIEVAYKKYGYNYGKIIGEN